MQGVGELFLVVEADETDVVRNPQTDLVQREQRAESHLVVSAYETGGAAIAEDRPGEPVARIDVVIAEHAVEVAELEAEVCDGIVEAPFAVGGRGCVPNSSEEDDISMAETEEMPGSGTPTLGVVREDAPFSRISLARPAPGEERSDLMGTVWRGDGMRGCGDMNETGDITVDELGHGVFVGLSAGFKIDDHADEAALASNSLQTGEHLAGVRL